MELKSIEEKLEERFRDYPVYNFHVWKEFGLERDYIYMVFIGIKPYTLETARDDLEEFKKLCREAIEELREQYEKGKKDPALLEGIEEYKRKMEWTLKDYLGENLYRELKKRNVLVFKREKYGAGCPVPKNEPDEIGVERILHQVRDKMEELRLRIPDSVDVSKLKRAFKQRGWQYLAVERLYV